jgi:hypothetical protein
MERFHLHCETCAFEREVESLEDAFEIEVDHKSQHGSAHEVAIERLE